MDFDFNNLIDQAMLYLPKVVLAIVVLVIGIMIINRIAKMVSKLIQKRGVDESLGSFLSSLVGVGLKILLLLSVASMVGIETTSFVAIFGAMAFAVGMALQGSLGNFASGVLILFFKPFKVGDLVEVQGKVGVVEAIQLFTTNLNTPDNKIIIIPNSQVTSGPITNISGKGTIRIDMVFGIGYTDDIDKAREVIKRVIASCPVALDKEHDILVTELADSSVNFAVRVWVKSADYWDGYFFMHETIKKEFDKEQIGIPYPQMDVHVHQQN